MQNHSENTIQTSSQALQKIGNRALKSKQEIIKAIVVDAQRRGVADLSGREIQRKFESIYGVRIDSGEVSARIKNMVDAGQLCRVTEKRVCSVSGFMVHPVCVLASQARLVE